MATTPGIVSLFSGCGGLDLGFQAAGFETLAMVEIASYATATLRSNFPRSSIIGPPTFSGDLNDDLFLEQLPRSGVDIVIGGPPCQPFSIASAQRFLKRGKNFKRIGFEDHNRGGLIYRYMHIVKELRPRIFLIENVPGLAVLDEGARLADIIRLTKRLGYRVAEPRIIEAADFGVPQFRKRLFIVGIYRGRKDFEFPLPTHGDARRPTLLAKRLPYCTVAEALLERPGGKNHVVRRHNERSIERYKTLSFGERDMLGRVNRLDPYQPSRTIIAGGTRGGGRPQLHPFVVRTLTVRESARLQTFPDHFEFHGSVSRQFTQVGNAVPPLLAEALARAIGSQIYGMQYDTPLMFAINRERSINDCVTLLHQAASREQHGRYEDTPSP